MNINDRIEDPLNIGLDPFGTRSRRSGVSNANSAIQQAANEFDLRTGNIDYNVSADMVNRYMSPDVKYRQNAATQSLAQLYGNSGALNSSAARSGIMNANAGIAAQAWNDAFNRANDITKSNNELALGRSQNMYNAQTGQAANSVAAAMNERGFLGNVLGGAASFLNGIFG